MRLYYTYILSSHSRALYTGVTNNIKARTRHHQGRAHISYTNRYGITKLVYYEVHRDVRIAITREKVIKRWPRSRKYRLIEQFNPDWRDLSVGWSEDAAPEQP